MKMFRISISLAMLTMAGAITLSGCDFLSDKGGTASSYSDVITYTHYENGNYSLIAYDLSSGERTVLVDTVGSDVVWASDGERIACTARYGYFEEPQFEGPSFDDSGPQIFAMNVETGERRLVTLLIAGQFGPISRGSYSHPVWSPNGKRIAYARCTAHGSLCDVRIAALDTSNGFKEVRVTDNHVSDYLLDWSPDGKKVLLESDPDGNEPYDPDFYQIDLKSFARQRVLASESTFVKTRARYGPKGDKIAFLGFKDGKTEIYTADVDGSDVLQITNNSLSETSLSWSPNGSMLAFAARVPSDYPYKSHIYTINIDGSNPQRVTSTPGVYGPPEWRPMPNNE